MSDVLIVGDMQRGFLEPGRALYCGDQARAIIPRVRQLVKKAKAAGMTVFFIADTHTPNDEEFQMWAPHCLAGSEEWEIVPELADLVETVIPKSRYSAFYGTGLAEKLAALQPDRLIICGVCTDICVNYTVADARQRNYKVIVPADCVATFDPAAHNYALQHMEKILGAKVVASGEEAI